MDHDRWPVNRRLAIAGKADASRLHTPRAVPRGGLAPCRTSYPDRCTTASRLAAGYAADTLLITGLNSVLCVPEESAVQELPRWETTLESLRYTATRSGYTEPYN
jgi:hypothetical protein